MKLTLKQYTTVLLTFLLCGGCLEEGKIHTTVEIQVEAPAEFDGIIDFTQIDVSLFNTTSGMTYTAACDASGKATFQAEYGFYSASLQHKMPIDGVMNIFNGVASSLSVTPGEQSRFEFNMSLSVAKSSQLVFKEFYYFGCKSTTNTNYSADCYVSIYNNSDMVAYLDNLCIGMVSPMTSASASKFIKEDGSPMDVVPLDQMAWSFPGSGQDHPLLPGEDCVIAYSAINHNALHANAVDNSKADFAFWTDEFDMSSAQVQQPTLGVKYLNCMWRRTNTTRAFPITTTAKALVIFRTEGVTPRQFGDNPVNTITQPGVVSTTQLFLAVPKEWVLDGIECVTSSVKANKRLHPDVDAGYYFIDGGANGCGKAVIRKVEEVINGRVVYADSNDSKHDLETTVPTRKNL